MMKLRLFRTHNICPSCGVEWLRPMGVLRIGFFLCSGPTWWHWARGNRLWTNFGALGSWQVRFGRLAVAWYLKRMEDGDE